MQQQESHRWLVHPPLKMISVAAQNPTEWRWTEETQSLTKVKIVEYQAYA